MSGPDAVHAHAGLSYANYLVVPRTLLQSMPDPWQNRFVACLDELADAFRHVDQAAAYDVTPGTPRAVCELDAREMRWLNITEEDGVYYDAAGDELADYATVVVPADDPVPHYDRGRARIAPRIDPAPVPIVVDDVDPRAILTRESWLSWSVDLHYGIGRKGPYVVWGWTPKHARERAVRRARVLLARLNEISDPIVVRPDEGGAA